MVESIYITAGIILVIVVFSDIIWTMMGEGAGFLTRRITNLLWGISRKIYNRGFSDFILLASGITVIIMSLLIIILLLWFGWVLIFLGSYDSVVDSITKLPGDLWDKIYFVGFTVFTLGTGDFIPNGKIWQILTPVASLSGLFLVTFSITYLVPVIQAATYRRSLSVFIFSFGNSAEEIIDNFWNGEDVKNLLDELNSLSKEIAGMAQKHKAYPVLYYLHSLEKRESLSLGLSRLNDSLIIILHAFKKEIIEKEKINIFRRNLDFFLETLSEAFIKPAENVPPLPDIKKIQSSINLYEQTVFEDNVNSGNENERRLLLYGFILEEGREWKQIKK